MNIENNFRCAEAYLEMAHEKVESHDFETALAALVKAYEHTRSLLEQVFKLQALKAEVETPAGEDSV